MDAHLAVRRIVVGNLFFIGCCVFYLAWWVFCFRPVNPVKGMRTGWLLIVAAVLGLIGVVGIIRGVSGVSPAWFHNSFVVIGWVVVYVIAAIVTRQVFDRPMTSELLLFTGWAALMVAEVNALHGSHALSVTGSVVFFVVVGVVLVIDLVCYTLYYKLASWRSYIDGMVPLVLSAVVMGTVCLVVRGALP